MKSTPKFGAVVEDLTRAGFAATDLLPLIPPGAILSENSQVQPFQIGKIPGRYRDGKWSGLSGQWASLGMSERDVAGAKNWPTTNVGLRAGAYPGIDIDTDSKEAFAMVEKLLVARFGDAAPVRYRGDAPRALYAFRLDGDSIRKHRVEWKDAEGRDHAVEVLGLGQQYAIQGIHPTGVAYEWREPVGDLAAVTANGLPRLSVDDVMEFIAELKTAIAGSGGELGRVMTPRYGWDGSTRALDLANADPFIDNAVALEALNSVANTPKNLPTRESIVALLAAFKAAVGRNAESLRPDALEWATQEHDGMQWADEAYFDKVWDSLTTSRVPFDHLISMARRFGWRGDAALDFEASAEEEQRIDRQIRRVEQESPLAALADKLAYIPTLRIFVEKQTGLLYRHEDLNTAPHLGSRVTEPGTTGKQSASNLLCAANTTVDQVQGVVFLPGEKQITQWEREGRSGTYYNRWHARTFPLFPDVIDADVKPWLDHVAYLVPDRKERAELLDFFAHLLQKRGTKVRWAPLIIGKQGTGKDLMIKPIVSYLAHNARSVKPETLTAKFTDFYESELLVVQELKKNSTQANSTYNRIKTLIAGDAEDVVYVEKKFQAPYAIPNVVNSIFFSNHVDALEIDPDDRRFFVLLSEADKRDPSYYQRLAVDFYGNNSGWLKVASWLLKRDISKFNASQPPMQTDGKALLIDAQRSTVSRAIEEALTTGPYKDRVAVTASEIVDRARSDFAFMPGVQRNDIQQSSQVVNELRALTWVNHGNVKVGGKVLRFWTRPGVDVSNDQIRIEYEKARNLS